MQAIIAISRFARDERRPWLFIACIGALLASPSVAETNSTTRDRPDIDVYALMSGKCPTLSVDGHEYKCKAMAYFHGEKGRASFAVVLDDPNDSSHVVAFSGEYGSQLKTTFMSYPLTEWSLTPSIGR